MHLSYHIDDEIYLKNQIDLENIHLNMKLSVSVLFAKSSFGHPWYLMTIGKRLIIDIYRGFMNKLINQ